jgi:hypothetical protein
LFIRVYAAGLSGVQTTLKIVFWHKPEEDQQSSLAPPPHHHESLKSYQGYDWLNMQVSKKCVQKLHMED